MHRFRCYDNIVPNAKCQRVLVLAVCLVTSVVVGVISDVCLSQVSVFLLQQWACH